ncbi:uncharacterized protein PV06_08132 [Exophiala oligosperma]|uniref:3-keto-steroid reductase n=1 Tax=Exophiala oligosperma TaxID=215243 RepID=A0A0D2D8X3_9EURO|nr:uncharacterized protein PV06_08132 [Exophiala oligosperma]KIW39528.1 hypothetical protein PV06_08132 [Exophiala oligosperma]
MSASTRYVLVTGANSGLGLGICCRLIDEFLTSPHIRGRLTIIFTTRGQLKGDETLTTLQKHLSRHASYKKSDDRSVTFQPENVELTSLLSVRALSRKLLSSNITHLDAIVLNAGIGGWSGLNWPVAIWTVLTGIRQATTWPTFKLGFVGLVTKPQFPPRPGSRETREEPVLGEVFCANTFGHYMLVHWLMPLIRACPSESSGKIIWTSSVDAVAHQYNPDDHQGLKSGAAYESTKRLTDLLALTATTPPASTTSVKEYITPSPSDSSPTNRMSRRSEPTFLLAHPGICTTTIISLYWIIHEFYRLGIYLARWCGSPWANVSSYLGAASVTWLILASRADIDAKAVEASGDGGPCKWGSAVDLFGRSSVRVTDVEGWGINGTGKPFKNTWWGGSLGRKSGAVDATAEDVESFVSQGAEAWRKMEALRKDWEARIDEYESEHTQEIHSNGHAS